MKKRMISILLVFCMIFSMMPVSASAAAGPTELIQISWVTQEKLGLSSSDVQRYWGYYAIRNAAELFAYGEFLSCTYDPVNAILLHDIFLEAGTQWTPLCMNDGGIFDGNGKTIGGIWVNMPDAEAVGFFSYVANGTIRNLTISGSNGVSSSIVGKVAVGAIAGQIAGSTTIENCAAKDIYLTAQTDDPLSYIGGLVGHATSLDGVKRSVIENSYFGGTVTVYNSSTGNVGCIIGDYTHVTVSNCTWLTGRARVCDRAGNLVQVVNRTSGTKYQSSEDFESERLSSTGDSHTHRSVTTTSLTATCEYGGYDSYSYCLVCDVTLAGNKNQTGVHHEYSGGNCSTEARCTLCGAAGQKKPDLHSWSYGKCEWCSKPCNHSYDSDSMCTICRATCPHQKYENGTCKECGNSGILARFDISRNGMGLRVQERVKNSSDNTYTIYPRELVRRTEENDGIQLVLIEPGKIYAFILEIDDAQNPGGFVSIHVDGIPTAMNLNTSYHSDGDTVFSICDHSDTEGTKCNACGKQLHTCTPGDTWTYNGTRHWRVCADASCGLVMDYETHTISSDTGRCVDCDSRCEHVWNDHSTCTKCGYVCEHVFHYSPPLFDGTLCYSCFIECKHTWENGHCSTCNYDCIHSFIVDGICELCGAPCPHHEFVNGVCTACGAECTHTWENGYCGTCDSTCSHSYVDGICEICGTTCHHEFVDSVCTVCGEPCIHDFASGKCISCGILCTHNYKVTLQHGPFCTAEGLVNYRCTDCGNEYSEILPSLGGHKYNYTVTDMIHEGVCETCENRTSGFHEYSETYTAETCTEDAYFTYTCDDCGYSYTRTSTAKLGHSGGEATCKELAVCERCGEGYGEIGDHVGGEATCTEQAICDVCGEGYGELKHHESDLDDSDCTTPVRCSVCGAVTKEANATHTWGEDNFCSNENCQQTKGFTFTFTYGDEVLFVRNVHTGNFYTFEGFEARDGLTLVGWDADDDGEVDYAIDDYIYVEGDLSFNAVYKLVYTVRFITYDIWEGSYTEFFNPIAGEANQTVTLGDDSSPYYKFLGWAMEEGGEVVYEANEEITLTQDLILYGVIRPYRATFELGEGAVWNDENGNPITVLEGNYSGDWIEIRQFPTRTGYIFKGFVDQTEWFWEPWQDEDTGEWVVDFNFDMSDRIMTAVWEKCTAHIFVDSKCTVCAKECEHDYVNGDCTICGKACDHAFDDEGICSFCGVVNHSYANGFCTVCGSFEPAVLVSDYYEIGNAGQLYWFAKQVNEGQTTINGKLTANIVVNEAVLNTDGNLNDGTFRPWTPIGSGSTPYTGTFDGDNHTISGLYLESAIDYVGLLGYSEGTAKNVGVVDSYLRGKSNVGGVVGYNTGTVESCYNAGTVSGSGDEKIGGVVGWNEGALESCYNTGTVSGSKYVGGVVGWNEGALESCYNTGTVSGNDNDVGGVVGFNRNGTVEGCYNAGTVGGRSFVGGVVGDNSSVHRISVVTNCYNTGAVSASGNSVGGVAGCNGGDMSSCYNTGTVSTSGQSVGGVAGSNGGEISCCYNTGTVSGRYAVGGVVGYNGAGFTVINSYNNSDAFSGESIGLNDGTAVDVLNKTGAQFASGEVAYLLQGDQTQQVWGQNVDGEGEKDAYPIFSEVKVYPVSCCLGKYGGYSNTEGKQQAPKYNENGFCIYCGGYESATGSGTESDPYQISNAGQLYWFASVVNTGYGDVVLNHNAWAELTANITVNEAVLKADGSLNEGSFRTWTPIGGGEERYFGTFDGNGFAVSGLYFYDTNAQSAGLFGWLEGDAVVQNVGVVDSYIRGGNQYVGAVVGVNIGTVAGCYNAGTVIVGESSVGGIVGENYGPMTNCYSAGPVSGNRNVGGVVGYNGGPMTNCYSAGPVSGNGENIGGVTGINVGSVTNCYYDSTVYGGEAFGNNYGTATNVEGKTTGQFKSGEVAYLLGEAFGQDIGSEASPVLGGAKVSYGYDSCAEDAEMVFTNAQVSDVKPSHSIMDGKCQNCDYTEEPAKFEIVQQPVSVTGTIGETVSVTVVATGEGLTYRWYIRNGGGSWSLSSITTATYEVVMDKSRANRELYCVITDANGNTLKTDVVSMTGQPNEELKILTQPTNAEARLGENYCVEVIAQGDGLRYTWYWRNKGQEYWNLSSVKDNTYDDVMNASRAGREVYCVITDAWGNSVTTETVTLVGIPTVDLAIVTQPNDSSAKLDERFCVTVEAQGEGLTYTWYWRNKGQERWNVSGVKDNTYDDVMTKARHNREVYCVITDAFGNTVTSDIALITGEATMKLEITQQPTDAEAKLNQMYCVTVEAVGEDIHYQWYFKNKGSEQWSASSVKDNTYDDIMTSTRAGREVYCVITDAWGNSVTTDTVTLVAIPDVQLAIIAQPEDESVKMDEMFCVTVEAQGDGLKYQWYWRQVGSENWNVSGQRDNTYDDVMTKGRNNREVYCVITDAWGDSVETNVVTITAIPTETLAIVTQPTDASAAMGDNYCVTVEAVGDGLSYTWYFKNAGTNTWSKSGVTDNTYDDVMTKARAGRQVYCVITDAFGNQVTTEIVTLICTDIPQAIAMN